MPINLKSYREKAAPKKPYRDLDHFRKCSTEFCAEHRLSEIDFFPCFDCGGRGKIYDPNEQIDPVEGRKFASRIPCGACNSRGTISRSVFMQAWRKEVAAWKKEMAIYKSKVNALQGLRKRLTEEEVEALESYFYHR